MTDYIQDLKDVIRRLHGAEATHMLVRESQEGLAAWEGVVEVFDLVDHPTAHRVYAWAQDTDDPKNPRRYITVLHQHPIKSAHDAVRSGW